MLVHSSELYKAPKVFYSIDMVYPQANTFFSCNLYIILLLSDKILDWIKKQG